MNYKNLIAVAIVSLFATTSFAQERLPEYLQAEKYVAGKLGTMLFDTEVHPHWIPGSTGSFWYSYKTSEGVFWYIVNPTTKTKAPLFNRDEMAAQLTEIMHDPFEAKHLPIANLKAEKDGHTFTFQVVSSQDKPKEKDEKGQKKAAKGGKQMFYFSFDYNSQKLTHLTEKTEDEKFPRWASISPDKKTVVFAKDLNLYKMSYEDYLKAKKDEKDSTIVETQITTDGELYFGYGTTYSTLNTDTICNGKRKHPGYLMWSPDSKHFAMVVTDERKVKELWVINSNAQPRPTLETYKYHMPGEKEAPIDHLYLFNTESGARKEIKAWAFKDQTLELKPARSTNAENAENERSLKWLGDNNTFYVERTSRDLHRVDICSYTMGADSIVPIIKERMNTYIDTRNLVLSKGGNELIHWSERDGWAHLYLYDNKGNLKNRLTKGSWHVQDIVKIDEKNRIVYFTANGMDANENPYYEHLYRVNFDGSGLKLVTKGDFFHKVAIDDNAAFVIDNYSRINSIPATSLLDATGNKIMTLQESDFSQLFAAGYKFPEPFKVKAADGVTDLYGVMYKPYDMDTTKVYPIVDYVYPGPQVEGVYYPYTRMSPRTDRLAQAGFIVISVGQRGGHPSRSKWYHNYGYGNMRDYPLADHKYAIEQLANKYKFIDINKVGIHGHSGGGFMSTAAICQYPDFFKVAVSCAGNHDNTIYNRWWSEKHHGVKEVVNEADTTFLYKIGTNPEIARNLKGHLMLVHGDIDNNVHPANTMRVVDALIRAGKRFELVMLPQQRHGFGNMNEYFYWKLVDFFSQHLKGNSERDVVDIPKR